MDYELFLLGLATAPGSEIVSHFIAALSLLLLECKIWLPLKSSAILVASGHNMTHFKAALNLLLLATTWIKAVTHYKAVPFLLLLATTWFTWNRDAFYDRTTCCLFLLGILGLTHFKAAVFLLLLELKSQLPFKAVPVLLLLAEHDLKSCIYFAEVLVQPQLFFRVQMQATWI